MLFRLFRLPPIVYLILAPLVLVLGVFLFITENDRDAQRAAALSHAAPGPVEIQSVSSVDTGNDFNEIVVAGQADVANMVELTKTRRGLERGRKLFIPLYPTDATDFSGPVTAVVEIRGAVSDAQLDAMYVGDGPAGPVLMTNGVLSARSGGDARKALEARKTLAAEFYTIEPFMNGRDQDLKPKGMGSVLLGLAFVIAALLGGYGYFRKRKADAAKQSEQAEQEVFDAA